MESPFSKGNHVAEIEMKEESSSNVQIGIVTWNVNHMRKLSPFSEIENLLNNIVKNFYFYCNDVYGKDGLEEIRGQIEIYLSIAEKDAKERNENIGAIENINSQLQKLKELIRGKQDLMEEIEVDIKNKKAQVEEQEEDEEDDEDDEDEEDEEEDDDNEEEDEQDQPAGDDDEEYVPSTDFDSKEDDNELYFEEGKKETIASIKKSTKEGINTIKSDLKKIQVIKQINHIFKNNSWLDIMIVQEVNKGVVDLETRLNELKSGLKVIRGPQMQSFVDSKGGQIEYYPLIIRDNKKCDYCGFFQYDYSKSEFSSLKVNTNETSQQQKNKKPVNEEIIKWDKRTSTFRPVILYKIIIEGKPVYVGNLHTTPGGGDSEFYRQPEYDQINEALQAAKKIAKKDGNAPLIIGGDYYLFRESRVFEPELKIYLGDNEFLTLLGNVVGKEVTFNEEDFRVQYITALFVQQIFNNINTNEKNLRELFFDRPKKKKNAKKAPTNAFCLKKGLGIVFENTDANSSEIMSRSTFKALKVSVFSAQVIALCFNELLDKKSDLCLKKISDADMVSKAKRRTKKGGKKVPLKEIKKDEKVKSWQEKLYAFIKYYEIYIKENIEKYKSIKINKDYAKHFANLNGLLSQSPKLNSENSLVEKERIDFSRNDLNVTFAHQMENIQMSVAQPVGASNRHRLKEANINWTNFHSAGRIADFFLYKNVKLMGWEHEPIKKISDTVPAGYIGHLHPNGKIILTDDENLSCSRYWQILSDHFPIGAVFSNTIQKKDGIIHTWINKTQIEDINKSYSVRLLANSLIEMSHEYWVIKKNLLWLENQVWSINPSVNKEGFEKQLTALLRDLFADLLSKAGQYILLTLKTIKMWPYSEFDIETKTDIQIEELKKQMGISDEDEFDKLGKVPKPIINPRKDNFEIPASFDNKFLVEVMKGTMLEILLFQFLDTNVFNNDMKDKLYKLFVIKPAERKEEDINKFTEALRENFTKSKQMNDKDKFNTFIKRYNRNIAVTVETVDEEIKENSELATDEYNPETKRKREPKKKEAHAEKKPRYKK